MIDLTDKSVLVYDLSGSYTFIAETLAQSFGRVLYANQWETGFSNVDDFVPGVGLEGVERATDPFEHFDTVDLVIFPDVGMAGLQEWLRRQGIPVWGSGAASRLERDRVFLKEQLAAQSMDVADWEIIEGLSALREYLAEHEDVWIKVSYFRGVGETFHHEKPFLTEQWLDEKALALGAYKEKMKFLVENPIAGRAVESGIDTYGVRGAYPERILWGYEDKDNGYLGTVANTPSRLQDVADNFLPILREFDYRGPLSLEFRHNDEGQDFLIDVTARFPSPPSEVECKIISNLAEIMYMGARGYMVQPIYAAKYAAQLVVKSDVLEGPDGRALAVEVGMPDNVLLHGHCRIDGVDYVVSPAKIPEFGGAVGIADSAAEAMAIAFEAAESIVGNQVSFSKSAFDDIMNTIREGDALGLDWGVFVEGFGYGEKTEPGA